MLNQIKITILIISATLIMSCKHSKPKTPDFIETKKLEQEFGTLIQADNININGSENDENSVLEINIINGKSLSTIEDEQRALAHSLARIVKVNLKDSNQFDTYMVKFGKKSEGESLAIETYTRFDFKLNEL